MNSITKEQMIALCRKYGPSLDLDLGATDDGSGHPIDGTTLLWALSGRESDFGANMKPRHEPAFDVGGPYSKTIAAIAGLNEWHSAFACSYGPLQIMAVNAPGFSPAVLLAYPEQAMLSAVCRLKSQVLIKQKAYRIGQICECWNDGHIISGAMDPPAVQSYIDEVTQYYLKGIPQQAAEAGA
jgi:hypothetical protein